MTTRSFDQVLGWLSSAAGSVGLTVQLMTDFANLALIVGNGALVVGGFVLLYRRLQLAAAERQLAEARLKNETAKRQAAHAVTDIALEVRKDTE